MLGPCPWIAPVHLDSLRRPAFPASIYQSLSFGCQLASMLVAVHVGAGYHSRRHEKHYQLGESRRYFRAYSPPWTTVAPEAPAVIPPQLLAAVQSQSAGLQRLGCGFRVCAHLTLRKPLVRFCGNMCVSACLSTVLFLAAQSNKDVLTNLTPISCRRMVQQSKMASVTCFA